MLRFYVQSDDITTSTVVGLTHMRTPYRIPDRKWVRFVTPQPDLAKTCVSLDFHEARGQGNASMI